MTDFSCTSLSLCGGFGGKRKPLQTSAEFSLIWHESLLEKETLQKGKGGSENAEKIDYHLRCGVRSDSSSSVFSQEERSS